MTFLVVDDSKTMRYLVKKNLRNMGIREEDIIVCDCGEQALDGIRKAPVDFLILDWHMPGISGLDVLRILREEGRRELAVVMLTTEQKRTCIEEALKAGVGEYIIKPLDPSSFRKKVLAVARRHGLDPYETAKKQNTQSHSAQHLEPEKPHDPPPVSEEDWNEVEKAIYSLEESGELDDVDEEIDTDDVEASLSQADDALGTLEEKA